mgnify:CR=1 FL=1
MTKCNACGQTIPQANGSPAPQKEFVPIGAPEKFYSLCCALAKMPGCQDRNRQALDDLPKTVARYRQLTQGQWKMFCAIHKAITGTWPPDKAEFLVEAAPMDHGTVPDDLSDVPF